MTRNYVILEVSKACFEEIHAKLAAAGYEHALRGDDDAVVIDMHGIALAEEGTT